MPEVHARRRDALRQTLADDEVDALLVTAPTNVQYLTGFTGSSMTLIVAKANEVAVSDGRYTTQIADECPDLDPRIRPVDQPMMAAVAEVVALLSITNLAFEANALLVADYETLREALPTVSFRGTPARVESLRAIKDDGEIAAIRMAIRAAERSFQMLRNGLRLNETEIDAADALESYLRRCGSSVAAFAPILAAGERSALPHAHPSAESRIGDSDFLLVDWGATVQGYRSDLTRVLVTGKVGTPFEAVYLAVLGAQRQAIAAIRPGVPAREVDTAARSAIAAAGYGKSFTHGLGHGIGLDIHELPRLRPESEDILEAGMLVTVEPGIYLPGWGGIRLEDDILVTEDGHEVLSSIPKSIETLLVP